ncbi:hypothetical protein GQ42DRAFT_163697 [Ramicandelaber brevisporus]|nr:hypothetical protein GQ42DRAFT_163697 [Ramicandelaber brevisporus]
MFLSSFSVLSIFTASALAAGFTGTVTTHGMGNYVDCQVCPCSGCKVIKTFHPGDKVEVACMTDINMGSWTSGHYQLSSGCWIGYGNVDGVDPKQVPQCGMLL